MILISYQFNTQHCYLSGEPVTFACPKRKPFQRQAYNCIKCLLPCLGNVPMPYCDIIQIGSICRTWDIPTNSINDLFDIFRQRPLHDILKVCRGGVKPKLHSVTNKEPILCYNTSKLFEVLWYRNIVEPGFNIHRRPYPFTLHFI